MYRFITIQEEKLLFTITAQAIITVALNSFKIFSFHFTFREKKKKKRRSGLPAKCCLQFHYNSTFKDEIFCGYIVDDTCNFDSIRASKGNFIR
jgi:hypothetical protein